MNNEKNKDSIFELCMKDLLIQLFKQGKTKSFEDGAISAFNALSTNIGVLARITNDRTLASMYMDINMVLAHLRSSRDENFIKKISKEEIQKSGRVSGESLEAALSIIDSFEEFDFFENEVVHGEKFIEKIKHIVVFLPANEKEAIIFELQRILNRAFNRAVYEEMPKLLDEFYENIVNALEKGTFGDMPKILEAEKLKWHSLDLGFP